MTGSDANDPRTKLTPGMYDAGEAAMGLKHIMLLKKPDTFDLGSNDPNAAKVNQTLTTVLGVADPSKVPGAMKLVLAGLGFANSDLAFQGSHLFLGNFYGVNIYDISNPEKPREVSRISLSDEFRAHWTGWDPKTERIVVTSGETPRDRTYLLKLDQATGALTVDDAFRDIDGQPGFSFAEREWPHGFKGVGTPHGAVFTR